MLVAMLVGGCSSPRQNFYAGQGFDVATTQYGLEHGFEEANPLADDMQGVLLMKVVYVGITEALAHMFPDDADLIYNAGGVIGLGAGAWNTYTITK